MQAFFESGRAIDFILAFVLLEAVLLIAYRMRTGAGIAAAPLLANLASGACLMLAVRSALTDAAWTTTAFFLLLAFAAHITDTIMRWRSS